MAAKKSQLKLGKRASKIFKKDLLHSIAIASVILNILFLVAWGVIINGRADQELFDHAYSRLCVDNYDENLQQIFKEADNEAMAAANAIEFKIRCVSDEFKPFYESAIDLYTQNALTQDTQ